MTVTIAIEKSLFDRLEAAAAAHGQDVNHYAVAALEGAVAFDEDPDADLTEEQIDAIRAGVQRGLDAAAEGRVRTLEEVIADKRKRFGLSL